jgi:hypothetical protein
MTTDHQARVAEELAKIATPQGHLQAYAPEELGACVGSRISARFQARETCTQIVEFTAPPRAVLEAAFQLVETHGQIVAGMKEPSPYPRVSGIFRSGWFGGVTAVVHCEITFAGRHGCAATLTGVAREGMFNQRSARRAVRRLERRLRQAVRPEAASG